MTKAACDLLTAFESLSPHDQQEVAGAMLRRAAPDDGLEGDLLSAAAELFQGYDAEEAARAGP